MRKFHRNQPFCGPRRSTHPVSVAKVPMKVPMAALAATIAASLMMPSALAQAVPVPKPAPKARIGDTPAPQVQAPAT
ncbi:MAG TPA: hypothetical protein DDW72_25385, partial [Afipia sp.]|nr:hypothetical protein [Afipia sp.]